MESDFYNLLCPEVDLFTSTGKQIILSDLVGDVIVLRFTRFHSRDIPYLIYLQHLCETYANKGLHLFFIHILGKTGINPSHSFSVPIIEDDGYVSGVFNARLNDLIIISKDFRIKFKNNQASNRIIYNQVIKFLYEGSSPSFPSEKELSFLMKKVTFKNIKNEQIENISDVIENKKAIINLFISSCFNCPESNRIKLLLDLAHQKKDTNSEVLLLFGKGNDFNHIKKFAYENNLLNLIVGVIQSSEVLADHEYHGIFKLDVDPRLFVFDEDSHLLLIENLHNTGKINLDHIRGLIK